MVRRFWGRVHSFIYYVAMVNIERDTRIVLLNMPVDNIPRHTQILIYFIFLVAKIANTTAWKSPAVNLALLKLKLTWTMLNKKIVSVLWDKQALFDKVWKPWLSYLQVPDV